jgi:hypothetical protein
MPLKRLYEMEILEPTPALNREKPYQLTNQPNGIFVFSTDHHLTYVGQIEEMKDLPPLIKVYDFEVSQIQFDYEGRDPTSKLTSIDDKRVSETLIHVINDYLKVNPNRALVFICDEDGDRARGAMRQRLYAGWYKRMGANISFEKINPRIITEEGDQVLYCGMFYRADCPDKEKLIEFIREATPQIIMQKFGADEE